MRSLSLFLLPLLPTIFANPIAESQDALGYTGPVAFKPDLSLEKRESCRVTGTGGLDVSSPQITCNLARRAKLRKVYREAGHARTTTSTIVRMLVLRAFALVAKTTNAVDRLLARDSTRIGPVGIRTNLVIMAGSLSPDTAPDQVM
ncbi:hypothetical protein DM02DRAFT_630371 [Periconia macrospinosa]|uniref:Uncharacterized protein n=1 Tax=Periconia macrospinosa TaxID=97972 RepID=A0A2V1DM54_9PLEO|nr:hypothetical protein DM02DRAFT_630371 [Periconia macrospinosa]